MRSSAASGLTIGQWAGSLYLIIGSGCRAATYVFSVSRFHVPQGRSKIAQRFIAGLSQEYKTSPVRDERMHRSSPIFSVAPPGLWSFSTRNPRLKPWATFDRPYRDF